MSLSIYINLPVTDLARSKAFYEAIGGTNNPQFSDDGTALMSFSPEINVMLLTHEKFATFTSRPIADSKKTAAHLLCLTRESREGVDAIVETAAKAGGTADPNPAIDYGSMLNRSFEDPDGHIWEAVWMDMAAFTGAPAEA